MADARSGSSAWAPLRIEGVPGAVDRGAGQPGGYLDADRGRPVAGGPRCPRGHPRGARADRLHPPRRAFALVGGVLADIFNRARLLVAVLASGVVAQNIRSWAI